MSEPIAVMRMAEALAAHAGRRQTMVARNVANADTPGYKARDLPQFRDMLENPPLRMARTRPTHILPGNESFASASVARGGQASPNGNDVSVEGEMMEAARIRSSHDLALTIYSSARDLMTSALGRGR